MSKNSWRYRMKIDPHVFEAPQGGLEDDDMMDFGYERLPFNIDRDERWNETTEDERQRARRHIERRIQRKTMRSKLNGWSELEGHGWN